MYKLNGFRDLEQIAKFLGSSATNNMVINEVVFDSRQAKKIHYLSRLRENNSMAKVCTRLFESWSCMFV